MFFPPASKIRYEVMLSESLKAVLAQQLLKTADGKGRCAAAEILIGTPGITNLIRESKLNQITSVMQTSSAETGCRQWISRFSS